MKKKSRIHAFLASFLALFALTPIALGDFVSGGGGGNEANLPVATTEERAVCYVGSTRYTSLSKAIELTSSGTIFVYPELKNADETLYTVNLDASCTLKSGVTLSLPYSGETVFDSSAHAASGNNFADATTSTVKTNRKTQVLFQPGVVLTMQSGSVLNIGGILGTPNAGLSGQTSSSYCEIALSDGAGIECNGGNINCYGYIKQTSNTASTFVNLNSGRLHSPFVIYDFKGGVATLGIYNLTGSNKFCPFAIFDIPNLQSTVKVVSGSTWETRTLVYIGTNSTYYPEKDADRIINFVGPADNKTALVLKSGYMIVKYTPKTNGITINSNDSGKTVISIFGEASIGSLSLTMRVSMDVPILGNVGKTINIDTNEFFFPVSYRLDLLIENGGILNIEKKSKIMPGCNVFVKEGGAVNITNECIIYQNFQDITTNSNETNGTYPAAYPKKEDAACIVSGSVSVTGSGALAGLIQCGSSSANLKYQTTDFDVDSPEYGGSYPSAASAVTGNAASTRKISEKAQGPLTNGSDLSFVGDIEQRDYSSMNDPVTSGSFSWYREGLVQPIAIESLSVVSIDSSGQNETNGWVNVSVTVNPSDAGIKSVKWTSDNSSLTFENSNALATAVYNSTKSEITANVTVTVVDIFDNSYSTAPASVTVPAKKSSGGCFAKGTPILLADGSYKNIENLTYSDPIMTWNFYTGEYEAQPLSILVDHGEEEYKVTDLQFENGNVVSIIADHGFFDWDLNKYVYLTADNYEAYIGHRFALSELGGFSPVKLVDGCTYTKTTNAYSLTSVQNYNAIANGVLTAPPPGEFYNWVEMGERLRFDVEAFDADVERYGLYGFEVFEPYGIPYETFVAFNGPYLKIPVEKGIFDFDFIIDLFNQYKGWLE